ncbi:ATP-binding protein [Kaistia adipata]|uniref:ATP-binding protein n=1 Tax=Kaistia adipata TaxID=166954 RepID=UPI0004004694|nr:ATP-binding protein [Kaistia adipata]
MNGHDLAYLDLSALPAVGAALLSARPGFVFAADGRSLLWANAAGIAFFGAPDLARLLERRFSQTLPATAEIARLARTLPEGATRLQRIGFVADGRLQNLAAACTRLRDADGANILLLSLEAPRGERMSLTERAERLVDLVASPDTLVAILDGAGDVVAASGDDEALAAAEEVLETLIAGIDRNAASLFKRRVPSGAGRRQAGIARFELDGRPHYLLLVGPLEGAPAERVAPPAPAPAILPEVVEAAPMIVAEATPEFVAAPDAEPEIVLATPEPVAPVADAVPREANEPSPGGGNEWEAPRARSMADIVEAVSEPTPETVPPAEELEFVVEPEAEVEAEAEAEAAPVPEPIEEAAVEPEAEPPVATEAEPFRFAAPRGPVRFVFQMDAAGRFSFVSPEFAEVVGPHASAIVGESWGDVAAARGLDAKGMIAALIARRDTWSGATLSWPVDGTDQRVAVDLAALPTFSRDRAFEGYRGFGVIRPSELRREPPANQEPTKPVVVPMPKAPPVAEPTNVVRLPRGPAPAGEAAERLSMPEQDAFRRIAVALGAKVGPNDPAQAAKPPVEAAEPVRPQAAEAAGAPQPTEAPAVDIEPPATETKATDAPSPAPREPVEEAAAEAVDAMPPVAQEPVVEASPVDEPPVAPQPEPVAPAEAPVLSGPEAPVVPPQPESAAVAPRPDPALVAELTAAGHKIAELEAILDTATDGVAVVDGEGRIVRINRSAEALFGVETRDVAGLPFTHLLAEESRKSALDYLEGLAQNGVASLLNDGREVIGRVPQGGLIPLFMTMGRLGETGKFCAVLRDITQWKNAEEELINARRAAETASMQKSDFLAKVSHEIRTPLNAIIGFSEVMMEERFGPIGTERYKQYLRDIHVSGAHLMSLLNDLLDLSKIEAGKMELNFEAVALNDIVMECVALMQPQANRERIIIRTSLSSQVPGIVADPRSIRQIVLNLVSNAIKFTLAGGQVIVSTALEERGEVTLRIRDTGIGMSEKDVETALMPFRQVATSSKHRSDGTGLGLPLTKALVEANRASFLIDSAVGQGTLIRVTFPSTRVLAG